MSCSTAEATPVAVTARAGAASRATGELDEAAMRVVDTGETTVPQADSWTVAETAGITGEVLDAADPGPDRKGGSTGPSMLTAGGDGTVGAWMESGGPGCRVPLVAADGWMTGRVRPDGPEGLPDRAAGADPAPRSTDADDPPVSGVSAAAAARGAALRP
jgi:hypothetical protein